MATQDKFTSAIVKVNPEGEEVYSALRDETQRLGGYFQSFVVNSPETVASATEDLVLASNLRKSLESLRKEYVDPLNSYVKGINDVFKPLLSTLDVATAVLKGRIGDYNTEQQRIKAEAERIEALRIEAAERAAKLALETGQPAPLPLEPVAPLPQSQEQRRVDTEVGKMHTRKIPKWELADFAQVPDKYKNLNEVLIGKLVRAGENDIPGIRIYKEDEIVVRPNVSPAPGPAPVELKSGGDIPF